MNAEEVEHCFEYIETAESYVNDAMKSMISLPMSYNHAMMAAQTYALLAIANALLSRE